MEVVSSRNGCRRFGGRGRQSCRYAFTYVELEWLQRLLSDVLLVRMTSDVLRPPEKRYNYPNALTGLVSLLRSEGMRGLSRGVGPNVVCNTLAALRLVAKLHSR